MPKTLLLVFLLPDASSLKADRDEKPSLLWVAAVGALPGELVVSTYHPAIIKNRELFLSL